MAHFFLWYPYKDQVIFLFHGCNIVPYSFENIRNGVVLVVISTFIFLCSLCDLCFLWVFSFFLWICSDCLSSWNFFCHVTLAVPRCPFIFKSEILNRWFKNSACLEGIYPLVQLTVVQLGFERKYQFLLVFLHWAGHLYERIF